MHFVPPVNISIICYEEESKPQKVTTESFSHLNFLKIYFLLKNPTFLYSDLQLLPSKYTNLALKLVLQSVLNNLYNVLSSTEVNFGHQMWLQPANAY